MFHGLKSATCDRKVFPHTPLTKDRNLKTLYFSKNYASQCIRKYPRRDLAKQAILKCKFFPAMISVNTRISLLFFSCFIMPISKTLSRCGQKPPIWICGNEPCLHGFYSPHIAEKRWFYWEIWLDFRSTKGQQIAWKCSILLAICENIWYNKVVKFICYLCF